MFKNISFKKILGYTLLYAGGYMCSDLILYVIYYIGDVIINFDISYLKRFFVSIYKYFTSRGFPSVTSDVDLLRPFYEPYLEAFLQPPFPETPDPSSNSPDSNDPPGNNPKSKPISSGDIKTFIGFAALIGYIGYKIWVQ